MNQGLFFHGDLMFEAEQWEQYGDHSHVRYYRRPDIPGESRCDFCDWKMHGHGWIDQGSEGHTVCPGDWIVTQEDGSFTPVHTDDFEATYHPVPQGQPPQEQET